MNGDCIEHLKELPDNSVDAIITDPPYGLEFMGKEWDKFKEGKNIAGGTTGKDTPFGRSKPLNSVYQYTNEQKLQMQLFFQDWAKECLRVLKHGGYLLSFGGTRTYHRMTCGIEDAGFEIRDCIMWLYGSGFPKSLNIGKQIDKMQGNERVKGELKFKGGTQLGVINDDNWKPKDVYYESGSSEWEGWGTALKPACEPIVVARKPLSEKNVALNVLKHGTGGINIDECRIGTEDNLDRPKVDTSSWHGNNWSGKEQHTIKGETNYGNPQGRFPSNIILDEEAGKMLDEQSGISKSSDAIRKNKVKTGEKGIYNEYEAQDSFGFNDRGGASRFFYCAKTSKSERNFGLDDFEGGNIRINAPRENEDVKNTIRKNNHPTVKPIKLMEYLIKLVSKEGATILDPFLGSGTTAIACLKTNRNFIGIEKEPEYIKIAEARIKPFLEQTKLRPLEV